MKRSIWLCLLSTLVVLTGVPAHAGVITLAGLLPGTTCNTAPDPNIPGSTGDPAGCWNLQNQNSDGTTGGAATGTAAGATIGDTTDITVTGSDANTFGAGAIIGPMVDAFGNPIGTVTQFTTVISQDTSGVTLGLDGLTYSGDLTFNWNYTTADAGSFYDPAGYFLCPAATTGFPSVVCGLVQLTSDIDALNPPDPLNPPVAPYAESGTVSVTLAPGDVFGAYVLTGDNFGGAGTITFSETAPEPASFLLIGGGLLALGGAGRKARRRREAEKTTAV
jgi:hypothetical protein